MSEHDVSARYALSFGPFRLFPVQRLLLEGTRPVRLGGRALDILIALLERPGKVVGKEELISRVWPNVWVEEGNLKVQVSVLRRTLGESNRYLATIPGRGYSFVAPVKLSQNRATTPEPAAATVHPNNLPAQLTRLIGRDGVVEQLKAQLPRQRLLTIVGPGGIGKTSVALAVAERLVTAYEDGVWLIDLTLATAPQLVPSVLASALGLEIRSDNPLPSLVASLGGKRMLLVLDNCAHVIEAAATLAIAILRGAPQVLILATSREPLRIEGERICRLSPLPTPPTTTRLTATEALGFPAVQLFVERASAGSSEFEFGDADAPVVGDICRRLDGLPLAIEFAAARVEALGVRGLAAHLDEGLRLLTAGRRAAVPRHRTLTATLDWSYQLLTQAEQAALQRLAVFAGGFTLAAASVVTGDRTHPEGETAELVAELVTKSLVAADVSRTEPRFRLLDTTRAYALAKLVESGEVNTIRRRHAEYHLDSLGAAERARTGGVDWPTACAEDVDNIRAALTWAFSPNGDTSIGVALAAAAAPIWLEMSLLTECLAWTEKALAALGTADAGTRREMMLQTELGLSLMYTQGMSERARSALTRACELAENLQDADYQLRALAGLAFFCMRLEDFQGALALARRAEAVAKTLADPGGGLMADCAVCTSLLFLGDYANTLIYAQRAYDYIASATRWAHVIRSGVDHTACVRGMMTMVQWLRGLPDQADHSARTLLADIEAEGHPVSSYLALTWSGCLVSLWIGNLDAAERSIAQLKDQAENHSLVSYYSCALGFEGQLSLARGDPVAAERLIRDSLAGLRQAHFEVPYTPLLSSLAEALVSAGSLADGLAAADEALQRAERSNAFWWMPEALRIKGEALLVAKDDVNAAAEHFRRSLDLAHRQGALSWELRAATSLARLRRDQGRIAEARDLLASVYRRFTEGFGTADLRAAKALVEELEGRVSGPSNAAPDVYRQGKCRVIAGQ